MSRFRAILVTVALVTACALAWRASTGPTDTPGSLLGPTTSAPAPARRGIANAVSGIAGQSEIDQPAYEPAGTQCDLQQLEKLQQFNRDNLQRRENSRLDPEAITAYRGLSLSELKALSEQGDTQAMMLYGMNFLFGAMGRNPAFAVDYFYYGMPVRDITPNPKGVPEDANRYAEEARRAFTEAAMRGRHAAFTFIGLTYDAEGKNAVDLFWISEKDYESLTEKQQFNVEPRIIYSHLALRIDPNMLPSNSPDRKMFEDNLALLGDHSRILDWLELDFREKMKGEGLSFPELPEIVYPAIDEGAIEACEEEGYSQWD